MQIYLFFSFSTSNTRPFHNSLSQTADAIARTACIPRELTVPGTDRPPTSNAGHLSTIDAAEGLMFAYIIVSIFKS